MKEVLPPLSRYSKPSKRSKVIIPVRNSKSCIRNRADNQQKILLDPPFISPMNPRKDINDYSILERQTSMRNPSIMPMLNKYVNSSRIILQKAKRNSVNYPKSNTAKLGNGTSKSKFSQIAHPSILQRRQVEQDMSSSESSGLYDPDNQSSSLFSEHTIEENLVEFPKFKGVIMNVSACGPSA